ncbi:MAG: SDR family oxidoreductase [Bacteroidota bacterium]
MLLKEKYGSWALITGASSGIGEEFARRLASEKMNLILVARRKEKLEILASKLKEEHKIKVVTAPVDLSKKKFLERLKEFVGEREVGVLINNAGFGSNGEFINANADEETKMVKLNCLAPTILTHYFARPMVERKKGAIIFLGSVVAFQPTPFMTTYSATKAFNAFMGDALWYELKKYNIDVLSLNPGGTSTEFQRVASSSSGPMPRTAQQVVNTAMKALGRKPSVVDGFYNKVLVVSSRLISRKLTLLVAGYITRKLYSKKMEVS